MHMGRTTVSPVRWDPWQRWSNRPPDRELLLPPPKVCDFNAPQVQYPSHRLIHQIRDGLRASIKRGGRGHENRPIPARIQHQLAVAGMQRTLPEEQNEL